MPRVSGNYTLPPGYRAISGEIIRPSQHNPPLEDIAQALTDSLPRDGSAPMTGNLPMGGNDITGLQTLTVGTVNTTSTNATGASLSNLGRVTAQVPADSDAAVLMWALRGTNRVFRILSDGTGHLGASVPNPATRIITQELLDAAGLVPQTRTITAGDGLTGGGDLSANRTFSVDNSVARRSGGNTFTGSQNFESAVAINSVSGLLDFNNNATAHSAIRFRTNDVNNFQIVQQGNGNLNVSATGSEALHYNGNTVVSTSHFSGDFTVANPTAANPTISLAANSVDTAELVNNAVTGAKMAPNSVGGAQYIDNSVTQAALANAVMPIGVGQSWGNYTAARTAGTAYTNTTGRPIMVSVRTNSGDMQVRTDGASPWVNVGTGVTDGRQHQSFIVPAGNNYRCLGGSVEYWAELR